MSQHFNISFIRSETELVYAYPSYLLIIINVHTSN